MATLVSIGTLAIVGLLGFRGSWTQFSSTTYPYTIQQPSSFRHVLIQNGHKSDYFFPDLGSYTTNVNIYAEPGRAVQDDVTYFHISGAQKVERHGTIQVMGHRESITRAFFHTLAGHWIEERISFVGCGLLWHLTASYDLKYRSLRTTMLHMLGTFRLRSPCPSGI
jgi:hypothetical protein